MEHVVIRTTVRTLRQLAKGPGRTALDVLARELGTDTPRTLPVSNSKLRRALVGLKPHDWAEVHIVLDPDPSATTAARRKRARRYGHANNRTGLGYIQQWEEISAQFETLRVVAKDREFKFVA